MGNIIKSFLGNGIKDSYPKKNFEPLRPAAESDEKGEMKPLEKPLGEPLTKPYEKPNSTGTNTESTLTSSTKVASAPSTKVGTTVTPKAMPPLAPNNVPNGQYNYYGYDEYGGHYVPPKVPPVQKPLVNVKLTIFLVENTKEVVRLEEELTKAISAGNSEYVCVINYGLIVRKGEVIKASKFDNKAIFYKGLIEEDACFYDAIEALGEVVQEYFQKIEETFGKRMKINSIDIIGIGRGFDNFSVVSREEAKKIISKISKYKGVTTKYCCLREEHFIQTAAMGFRSIVSIDRNYM